MHFLASISFRISCCAAAINVTSGPTRRSSMSRFLISFPDAAAMLSTQGLDGVFWHSGAVGVHAAKVALGGCILRDAMRPFHRFGAVAGTPSPLAYIAPSRLASVTLLGGFAMHFTGDAFLAHLPVAYINRGCIGRRRFLLGCHAIPLHRFTAVFRNASPLAYITPGLDCAGA